MQGEGLISLPALVKSMQHRLGMKIVFDAWYGHPLKMIQVTKSLRLNFYVYTEQNGTCTPCVFRSAFVYGRIVPISVFGRV